jgi:hypothetical protein
MAIRTLWEGRSRVFIAGSYRDRGRESKTLLWGVSFFLKPSLHLVLLLIKQKGGSLVGIFKKGRVINIDSFHSHSDKTNENSD